MSTSGFSLPSCLLFGKSYLYHPTAAGNSPPSNDAEGGPSAENLCLLTKIEWIEWARPLLDQITAAVANKKDNHLTWKDKEIRQVFQQANKEFTEQNYSCTCQYSRLWFLSFYSPDSQNRQILSKFNFFRTSDIRNHHYYTLTYSEYYPQLGSYCP